MKKTEEMVDLYQKTKKRLDKIQVFFLPKKK